MSVCGIKLTGVKIVYKFKEIESLHIEISSKCQASCPMCARNNHGGLTNPNIIERDIDIDFYKNMLPIEFIKQLKTISMCGNFGDPIMNNDLIPMVQYTSEHNPNIDFHLHTNGSARNVKWWEDLAKALPSNHLVLFGIDGLEDTHKIYRIGTDFNTIIRNAKAFIAAGGKARWNFITFKHNEHQLEIAKQMSKDLGFESFHEKQTSRFIGTKEFDVLDRKGNTVYKLLPPDEQKIAFIDRKTVENYKEIIKTGTISCQAERENAIYIDALGYLWPCCFLGSVPYQYSTPDKLVYNFMKDSTATLMSTIEAFGGIEGLDLSSHTIEEIVDSEEWQTVWDSGFEDKSILMCGRVCGKFTDVAVSQYRDQFLDLSKFND